MNGLLDECRIDAATAPRCSDFESLSGLTVGNQTAASFIVHGAVAAAGLAGLHDLALQATESVAKNWSIQISGCQFFGSVGLSNAALAFDRSAARLRQAGSVRLFPSWDSLLPAAPITSGACALPFGAGDWICTLSNHGNETSVTGTGQTIDLLRLRCSVDEAPQSTLERFKSVLHAWGGVLLDDTARRLGRNFTISLRMRTRLRNGATRPIHGLSASCSGIWQKGRGSGRRC